ncbi:hypothetical protein E2F46_14185 [Luteimonas aestuarii]|uniref:DUF4145 domain-containing protein n=1 Tax=Luteimonas aestuarii TaxID=453837 RepID=A0A4V3ALE7_9GAMM|nr:hypothetical protein [Luteimonas aestuarii]TDK22333.1 hypothetical protein E2F46_14185 [Luteimonas aestuarii]
MADTAKVEEEIEYVAYTDFMESTPPGQLRDIAAMAKWGYVYSEGKAAHILLTPEIQLHCPDDSCNGMRFFRCTSRTEQILGTSYSFLYLTYRCSNCQKFEKTFALAASAKEDGKAEGQLYKFGELPPFGPPTPPKLMKLIGPDREDFLKGRRCENQGLGVGAFIYYRRVVESQKNRILEEIVKVSEKLGAPAEKLATLRSAIAETQFTRALDMAKDVLPESLLINGHSPIKLLHSALSDGVHARTDGECMDLASSIRIVLGELSDRLSQALKDEAELAKALSTLLNRSQG